MESQQVNQEAAHQRADQSEHDVKDDAFAAFVDDLAGQKAGDEADHEPDDDAREHAAVVVGGDDDGIGGQERGEVLKHGKPFCEARCKIGGYNA